MTTVTENIRFRLRGGTAAALSALNEAPLAREFCVETDTGKAKLGDGVTAWNSLPYFDGTNAETVRDVIGAALAGSGGVSITVNDAGDTIIIGLGTVSTRINPRVSSAASGDMTPDLASFDVYARTALAAACTINAPTGTPVDGQRLLIRLKDNGTARAITWNAVFRALGTTLPTTTVIGKTTYVGAIYNAADTKWDVIAVAQEA